MLFTPALRQSPMLMVHDCRYARDSWRGKVSAIEPSVNVLSTAQVAFIRQVLEEIGDIAVLVEVSVSGLKACFCGTGF